MPRFVTLRHEPAAGSNDELHWDFMLQSGDVLVTWALEREPAAGTAVPAARIADHRIAYLDFEGPISGNRGRVTQWDQGRYAIVARNIEEWIIDLEGSRLRGRVRLVAEEAGGQRWIVEFGP